MCKIRHTLFLRILVTFTALASLASCASYKDIKITSCELESISPRSFTSVDLVLDLGVHNPTVGFTVSDISGVILHAQQDTAATLTGGPVEIARKSDAVYKLPCTARLGSGASLMQILSLVASRDLSDYTVDLTMRITLKGGAGRTLQFKDLKLDELIKKSQMI